MSEFGELLGVNTEQNLRFFIESLREEPLPQGASDDELFYVASVLAHYALVSRFDREYLSFGSPSEILDTFVLQGLLRQESHIAADSEMLEIAGSHTLLLVGFFRDQMQRRHNVRWYDQLGQSFYDKASDGSRGRKRAVLQSIAGHFPSWAQTCNTMRRRFHHNYYLLRSPERSQLQ
jgi:hypothetical protein